MPDSGHVLGVDLGWSPKNASSAVCRLSWQDNLFDWNIERFRYKPEERRDAILRVIGGNTINVVALDGPIRGDLQTIRQYRIAEAMLTRRLQKHIGKPGQSNSGNGILLNNAANEAAYCALESGFIADATHKISIHDKAITEAFPTSFLGLMLPNAMQLKDKKFAHSDSFFLAHAKTGGFGKLLNELSRGARFANRPEALTNHDDRAAFVCALTALCVVAQNYCAVGDDNGWIILPPHRLIAPEFRNLLDSNASRYSPPVETGGPFRQFIPT